MTYSHILWDFNGTILNDVEAGIKSINVLLSRRNMKIIDSVNSYRKIFCFPVIKYYKNLGLNLEKEPFEELAAEWLEQYLHFSANTGLYDGVTDVMSYIKSLQIPQIILSATEKKMLTGQLSSLGVSGYFDEILGLDNIHAYSKVDIAKEWMKRIHPQKAVLFGDTVHDFEVAAEIGIECVLIANGHQSKETLKVYNTPVYDNIKELWKAELLK
jgi:phosphoglycolate phosphatase